MGWSCSAAADEVMRKWIEFCVSQTGVQNSYIVSEVQYIIEIDKVEHPDGAITGYLAHESSGKTAGRWKIGGDGRIVAAPPTLRNVAGQW